MTFAADFADFMPDTVVAVPGNTNNLYGKWLSSGESVNVRCRIEGNNRTVKDQTGKEVVSSVQLITDAVYGLTEDTYRYTLPSRFQPNSLLTAITVERESDEDGSCYEVVFL